jgi:hypothetical protein
MTSMFFVTHSSWETGWSSGRDLSILEATSSRPASLVLSTFFLLPLGGEADKQSEGKGGKNA